MKIKTYAILSLPLLLAGCFTCSETRIQPAAMSPLGASVTNRTIAVRGFMTELTDYVTVYGYATVYEPGFYGRHHYHPGYYHQVVTGSEVPRVRASEAFLEQAKNRFEESGFNIAANPADYIVEVKFGEAPAAVSDPSMRALWWLCTIFTSDSAEATWTAKLKIYDNRTGKLVFHHDYAQKYDVTMFSPIPILGPTAYEKTTTNYMQCWCLSVLTDRATADASAFLAGLR